MSNSEHALLSASSAHRWLVCTAAPRFETNFPEKTSEYAEEGRLAHEFCELKLLNAFTSAMTQRTFTTRMNKLKKDPLYSPEMDKTSDRYIQFITEKSMSYKRIPVVDAEIRVDFSQYVPEGFGTCDCVMIGGNTINIIDYKHGKGVPVSAENNPQMRLYALGALLLYRPYFGGLIEEVCMTIVQPRVQDEPSSETISVEDLFKWAEGIAPIAQIAFEGKGEFVPGDHCRFCRGKAQCKARADTYTSLEDFKQFALPTPENSVAGNNLLSFSDIASILSRGANIIAWFRDIEEFALKSVLNGEIVPGWKAVAGRSIRTFSDSDAAIQAVIASGYDEALMYERKQKTLTEIEKIMGKAEFTEKVGSFVVRPPGKPTLVPITDKREPYSSAANDFADVNSAI